MRRPFRMASILLLAAVFVTGCAATVKRPDSPGANSEQVFEVPADTRHLIVVLEPGPDIERDENWTALKEEWVASLAVVTVRNGMDGKMVDRAPATLSAGELLVNVLVKDYRYRSQAARYGFGVMTGNAYLYLDITYKAPPDGRVIGTRSVSTKSTAWQGIFSAMTPKQVEAVVTDIVQTAAPK